MITPGNSLVIMTLAAHVHQVQFVHQAVLFQQREGPVYGYTIDGGLGPLRPPQDLRRIKVVIGGFDDFKDGPPLAGDPNAARGEFCLQTSRRLT